MPSSEDDGINLSGYETVCA